MTRVLVVEDNPDLAFGLRNNLEIEGYEVLVAGDGPSGLTRARDWLPDVVILRALRSEGFERPVLILTARGEEADKVIGFRNGADDYVTKPFGVLELLARIEALLRRSTGGVRAQVPPPAERFGDVEVDRAARTVTREGVPVYLAPMEFELLLALLHRKGAVASRQDLMREVWGHSAVVVSRTVDTHIAELRRKLEQDPADPKHILTVRKAGYRLER